MKKAILFLSLSILSFGAIAQVGTSAELGGAIGSSVGSISASGFHNWGLGSKKKFYVGTGVRFTSFFGNKVNFTSAPADLASDDKNVDTLLAPSPSLSSLNLTINLGYKISDKLEVGFNIDAIGISFGPTGTLTYIRNGKSTATPASPTSPNILLVGDNDKGSLNSHLFVRYKLTDHLGLKVAYQYLFNELTTTSKVQTIPSANDRFRAKSGMIYVGLNYNF
jgi:long-subunit fatty acid transport protein